MDATRQKSGAPEWKAGWIILGAKFVTRLIDRIDELGRPAAPRAAPE
jgi:hypothetical protein